MIRRWTRSQAGSESSSGVQFAFDRAGEADGRLGGPGVGGDLQLGQRDGEQSGGGETAQGVDRLRPGADGVLDHVADTVAQGGGRGLAAGGGVLLAPGGALGLLAVAQRSA